ncbi:hypothetical protein C0989_000096 [Termitomyces sp. Mn162]|nr:hypothetical protein C0989_000096 [Termitomyces sp. Mn162]
MYAARRPQSSPRPPRLHRRPRPQGTSLPLPRLSADLPQVSVFSIRPHSALAPRDAQAEWTTALDHLRRDGARPKQVRLARPALPRSPPADSPRRPHGNVPGPLSLTLHHRPRPRRQLSRRPRPALRKHQPPPHALLRPQRTHPRRPEVRTPPPPLAPTHVPSDATKSRFISTYRMPPTITGTSSENLVPLTKSHSQGLGLRPSASKTDNSVFIATVLELVKLVQAGLSLFGFTYLDGLLCDHTVNAIRTWILHIGEPCIGLQVRTSLFLCHNLHTFS